MRIWESSSSILAFDLCGDEDVMNSGSVGEEREGHHVEHCASVPISSKGKQRVKASWETAEKPRDSTEGLQAGCKEREARRGREVCTWANRPPEPHICGD